MKTNEKGVDPRLTEDYATSRRGWLAKLPKPDADRELLSEVNYELDMVNMHLKDGIHSLKYLRRFNEDGGVIRAHLEEALNGMEALFKKLDGMLEKGEGVLKDQTAAPQKEDGK